MNILSLPQRKITKNRYGCVLKRIIQRTGRLWRLFPIILKDHREEWKTWYTEEKERREYILPSGTAKRISHVGSTAIGKIKSKPIVDILIEVTPGTDMGEVRDVLCENGWI